MKVFTCNDHNGIWSVGSASVVVAENATQARRLLDAELIRVGIKLDAETPYTLSELATDAPKAIVLEDGNY